MRTLIVILALGLSACAHETTQMDRELALKLVDKAGRVEIIHTGSPLVSVTNASAPQASPSTAAPAMALENTGENCIQSPVYSTSGVFLGTRPNCVGWSH